MMHIDSVVVTLTDYKNKPLREYGAQRVGNGRKCDVFAPVDSEYKFLIKNTTNTRIKVDIDIDGSVVSGRGIVLDAYEINFIERFVDSDKKFKTSLKTGEGVADPSSQENGIIKVRVHKEKLVVLSQPVVIEHHHHHNNLMWRSYPTYIAPMSLNSGYVNNDLLGGYAHVYSQSINIASNDYRGVMTSGEVKSSEALATVEGSKSNQIFGATSWNGNDEIVGESVFTFYLKLEASIDPEFEQYLKLKEKYGNK